MNKNSRDFLEEESSKTISAPKMARSRSQIGSAYAPGAFFTFEGGLGSCISVPDSSGSNDDSPISQETKNQIVLRLHEVWQTWFDIAHSTSSAERFISPRQCLDEALLQGSSLAPLGIDRISFLNPIHMGYAPAPLTFVCNKCKLYKRFESAHDLARNVQSINSKACIAQDTDKHCQWRQLDVLFVHWAGTWEPARPGRWEWHAATERSRIIESCPVCRGKEFRLNTESPQIGKWFFYCANPNCEESLGEWRQHDRFTTEVFRDQDRGGPSERRMEPISYRASSAHYTHSEQFILFPESEHHLLRLIEPHKLDELKEFIGSQFGYSGEELTENQIREALFASGNESEWESYERYLKMRSHAANMGEPKMVDEIDEEIRKLKSRWSSGERPLITPQIELPADVQNQLSNRSLYTNRFDPFILAVEHEALRRGTLSATSVSGRAPFVRFNHLDNDLAPKSQQAKNAQEEETQRLMRMLGMMDLGLIREFDLCRFAHGYTRVSPVPTIEKRGQQMPVRLRLFDPLKNNKRPIYVITQANEAIYVKLDPQLVYLWLQELGVTDLPNWDPDESLDFGGALLNVAQPFGRYFSLLRKAPASTYRYVYSLLHTYSHLFMRNIAELSGLDLGSMGEYLFPLDLAFVVYRNGTTMDLGNLSSLWRNENNRFLHRLLEASSHRCNSGRLCDNAGGACPDCIMIPEVACIAQNQLLSRSVLKGGRAPREDETNENRKIPGFLEVVHERLIQ